MPWPPSNLTECILPQAEVKDLLTPELSFHTPPSSPPPFEAMSGDATSAATHTQGESPKGPTLRERLRNLGQTISVIRRFGGTGLVTSRPVQSSIRCVAAFRGNYVGPLVSPFALSKAAQIRNDMLSSPSFDFNIMRRQRVVREHMMLLATLPQLQTQGSGGLPTGNQSQHAHV